MALTTIEKSVRSPRHVRPTKDRSALIVALMAMAVSALCWLYFYDQGSVSVYKDAISHLQIARRTIDSPTPGFGQLGGVWLPLPHILMLPFVWNDWMYFSGLAGSIVSMAAYVATCVLLYKIVRDLTGRLAAGLVAVCVFALNPNVLYMQSTPMTEMLLFAGMTGMVYYTQRWIRTDRWGYLVGAAVASVVATLSRYEAWVLFAVLMVGVAVTCLRRPVTGVTTKRQRLEGIMLAMGTMGSFGILLWLGWNLLIFGNAFNWQNGEYAKPSLWVGADEPSVGHLGVALKTYWYAVTGNLSLFITLLALAALVVFIAKTRLRLESLPTLSLLTLFPFFVFALYAGQRPLHVMQISGGLYNVRFGLLMVLPAAIMIGYLASLLRGIDLIAFVLAIGLTLQYGYMASTGDIVTRQEPIADTSTGYARDSAAASAWLRQHYDGGIILSESFGNELVLFDARIPLGNNVYEGNNRGGHPLWEPSLRNPVDNDVHWILMRHTSGSEDEVFKRLEGTSALNNYALVYQNNTFSFYQLKG